MKVHPVEFFNSLHSQHSHILAGIVAAKEQLAKDNYVLHQEKVM